MDCTLFWHHVTFFWSEFVFGEIMEKSFSLINPQRGLKLRCLEMSLLCRLHTIKTSNFGRPCSHDAAGWGCLCHAGMLAAGMQSDPGALPNKLPWCNTASSRKPDCPALWVSISEILLKYFAGAWRHMKVMAMVIITGLAQPDQWANRDYSDSCIKTMVLF